MKRFHSIAPLFLSTRFLGRLCLALLLLGVGVGSSPAASSPAPNFSFRAAMTFEADNEQPPPVGAAFYNDMNVIPPDTHGAVSDQYVFTVHNTILRIFDRAGLLRGEATIFNWWDDVRGVSEYRDYFDPRLCFDRQRQRWYYYVSSFVNRDTRSAPIHRLRSDLAQCVE